MSTATAEPNLDLQEHEEEEEDGGHIICCCNRSIALCGAKVSEDEPLYGYWDEDDDTCSKCLAHVEPPCILCGYSLSDRDCACGKCWVWDLPDWQQNILRSTHPDLFI